MSNISELPFPQPPNSLKITEDISLIEIPELELVCGAPIVENIPPDT